LQLNGNGKEERSVNDKKVKEYKNKKRRFKTFQTHS